MIGRNGSGAEDKAEAVGMVMRGNEIDKDK